MGGPPPAAPAEMAERQSFRHLLLFEFSQGQRSIELSLFCKFEFAICLVHSSLRAVPFSEISKSEFKIFDFIVGLICKVILTDRVDAFQSIAKEIIFEDFTGLGGETYGNAIPYKNAAGS